MFTHNHLNPHVLTDLTVVSQVSGPGAVTYVAVPSLLTLSSVIAGGAAAPLLQLTGTEAAHARSALNLSQPADVTTLPVDEEVTHAADVTVVEQSRPDLGWKNQTLLGLR